MGTRLRYLSFNIRTRMRDALSRSARKKRMAEFFRRMHLKGGETVIDLGGLPQTWIDCPVPLQVHIVNLPGVSQAQPVGIPDYVTLHDGDARALTSFVDNSFDIVFSNSVIEHVGGPAEQQKMAAEVRRVAPAYWVQTPSIWFPIEAHSMMPFWWFYPKWLQKRLLNRWHKKLPDWTDMVAETTVIRRSALQSMLPDATIWTERKFGLPKSYIAYKPQRLEE